MAHLEKFDPHIHFLNDQELPPIAQTTVSTSIAKVVKVSTTEIPPEFHQYSKVFSNEEAQRLPKHQPWDHPIDLL